MIAAILFMNSTARNSEVLLTEVISPVRNKEILPVQSPVRSKNFPEQSEELSCIPCIFNNNFKNNPA